MGCFHDFGSGLTHPSNANTSGLEAVAWRWRFRTDGVWNYQEAQQHIPDVTCEPLVTAASAQARIAELDEQLAQAAMMIIGATTRAAAAEARADRLAKALEPFAAPHECDGHATVEDFNMEVQIFFRWAVIKAARAALQQETQP